jgi:tetratricopeptide (TPR) repeat protein
MSFTRRDALYVDGVDRVDQVDWVEFPRARLVSTSSTKSTLSTPALVSRRARLIAVSSAIIAACFILACSGGTAPPPAPTVAVARVIRGQMSVSRAGTAAQVVEPVRVEREAAVATADDGRGSVRLDGGAFLLLDRSTELRVDLTKAVLARGRAWVDASSSEETTVETSHGSIAASEATFAVAVTEAETRVYCGSGEVTFRTGQGSGRLQQGESLVMTGRGAPTPEPEQLWDDWTGGLADPTTRTRGQPTAVGFLAGRQLGSFGQARLPLPVRGHDVAAAIEGDLAVTRVTQTFFNARSETLEAEYVIRLPEGAIVSGFAVDQGNGFVESAINSLATNNGYELAWGSADNHSSSLAYDGPGRLRARIYPVSPGATVRVRLDYIEWLDRRGDMRTYVYPMGSGGEPVLLGELTLEIDISKARAGGTRAGMGARVEGRRVVLGRSDFRPRSDFYLDLFDEPAEEPADGDAATAYVVNAPRGQGPNEAAEGEQQYVLVDVPTPERAGEAPTEANTPLDLVVVVDVSGATDPEDLELSRSVVEAVMRQLTPADRVALLLADVTAHAPEDVPAEMRQLDAAQREQLLGSLARVDLGGATDLGTVLRQAAELVSGRPRGAVLYLGDGYPTTGGLDATNIRASLALITAPPRFFALGIGDDANIGLLEALFGRQARVVRERTEASRAIMELLAEAARPTLRGVSVDLGATVERVFPGAPITVPAGAHLRLVGRLEGPLPEQIRLTGTLDGLSVERTYRLERRDIDDRGDIRRRWAASRLAELLDEDAGREALVDLGIRFDIVTPWTTLVVGGVKGNTCPPIEGFDHDPLEFAYGMGGGSPGVVAIDLAGETQGWRRRARRLDVVAQAQPESTWTSRVGPPPSGPAGGGGTAAAASEEGLARAAAGRALALGERGPRGCYERRLSVRPDLAGQIGVTVEVAGDGAVRNVGIASNTLYDSELQECVVTEVRGIRFPSTGYTKTVSVTHSYVFEVPTREIGVRSQCSDASRQVLEVRRALWRERLAANPGVEGALTVWREASAQCELSDWRARRTLLTMMLGHVGGVPEQIRLYQAFGPSSPVSDFLIRAILRNVRTPLDVQAVRFGLGFEVPVDWGYFTTLWYRNPAPRARLALVRRWLEAVPKEMDLRIRLLALLEELGELPEARRVAHELRADPLADARVRTAVGEFWLRQENEAEARRVFSEIVEHASLDPWARHRLGDLYRAHGWNDDAYREYETLARLRPDDSSVMLLLARAAAGAGRMDEALRLEQRLSESVAPDVYEGVAAFARLWTTVRITRLKTETTDPEVRAALERRERASGALRDPPALLVTLTWDHPDDYPELWLRYPGVPDEDETERAPLLGSPFGIEAVRIAEREEGDYLFEVRRTDRDELRDTTARLMIVIAPGTDDEQVVQQDVRLTREERTLRFRLTAAGALEAVPVPRPRTP